MGLTQWWLLPPQKMTNLQLWNLNTDIIYECDDLPLIQAEINFRKRAGVWNIK